MERRPASHTEEEELNQRRRLLNLARKGDPKAINKLFELYQVRVYSGEALGKRARTMNLPSLPALHRKPATTAVKKRVKTRAIAQRKRAAQRTAKPSVRRRSSRRPAVRSSARRKTSHR